MNKEREQKAKKDIASKGLIEVVCLDCRKDFYTTVDDALGYICPLCHQKRVDKEQQPEPQDYSTPNDEEQAPTERTLDERLKYAQHTGRKINFKAFYSGKTSITLQIDHEESGHDHLHVTDEQGHYKGYFQFDGKGFSFHAENPDIEDVNYYYKNGLV